MELGVEFNFSFAPGISDEQIVGVELAGEMWSNYLGDTQQSIHKKEVVDIHNTVINIHVEVGSELLPENVIAGSFPAISDKYKYEEVYDALTNDITTGKDNLAVDSLTNKRKTDILVNGDLIQTEKMQLTTANLKALDLIDSNSKDGAKLDGYVLMSDLSNFDSVTWNYDYLGGAKEGTLDFLTTVTHELGHTLGFISGTDRVALVNETLADYQNAASINAIEQGLSISQNSRYTAILNDKAEGNKNGKSVQSSSIKFEAEYGTKSRDKDKFYKDRDKFEQALELLQTDDVSIDGKTAKKALEAIEKYLKYDDNWKDFIKEDTALKETKENLDPKKLASRMTSLDLFRYSNESFGLGANELTRGASSYFSLNGSQTDLAMSNGQNYQGSHWEDRDIIEGLGIMNPTVALNERWEISSNDLMAIDAIGWDVDYAQPLDMQSLYSKATAALDSASIINRQDDVDKILDGDAYEGRRSRRTPYSMLADDYFSTFSEPKAVLATNPNNEVLGHIDNWIVINNHSKRASASNMIQTPEIDDLANQTKSVGNVAADYLEIDESSSESDLLQEIKASLDNGLEIEMALAVL